MKKIAILLPNLKGGGAEKVALLLANEFIHQGYNVDMVLCHAEGEFLSSLDERIKIINLEKRKLPDILKSIRIYLKKEKPDALLSLMWPLTILSIIAFKIARSQGQLIVSDHTTFSESPLLRSRIKRWMFSASLYVFYPLAHTRLAVSTGVADDLSNLGFLERDSITVIHNPIEEDPTPSESAFTKQQEQEAWSKFNGKRVVAVGSLKWAKNYPLLLKAFKMVLHKEKAMLTIVGQGDLLPDLQLLAQKLNIAHRVQFVGFSKTPLAWMASADLLVLSSHYEGFGNVLVEAMSVGTPVISTDCKSGPREILDDGTYGILVPLNDARALADAMIESLQKEHDREALKLRSNDFSISNIAQKYLKVIFPE